MKILRIYLIITFFAWVYSGVRAQERLSGLEYRPNQRAKQLHQPKAGQSSIAVTTTLPFLDDFSAKSPFTSSALWLDSEVYINNQFAVYPPSYGVATFDALNDTGYFYSNAGPFQYVADRLTSVFINMSSLSPSDSVYLSFFYQPQGSGNDPERDDSLVLQFLEEYRADTIININVTPPDTTFIDNWQNVWSSKGLTLDTFRKNNNDKWFKLVMIPVKNSVYYKNTFRFRFFNYASLASNNIPSWQGNSDQWNVDYVYMNTGRSKGDTIFDDITIINEPASFLKNYTSMPFRQFAASPATEMRDSTEMLISNLGSVLIPTNYQFNIKDMSNTSIFNYAGGSWNLDPYNTSGYQSYAPHHYPKFANFSFPVSASDSSSYLITHYIAPTGTTQELIRSNDTVSYMQHFLNYYAYDDGVPELGYGLSPAGSQLAYRFNLNTADTLKGVLIAFNKTLTAANEKNFYLAAWQDNNGEPGDLIWRNKNTKRPVFNDTSVYSYYAFDSEDPIVMSSNSVFYVGVIQTTDDNLNIGFDVNNNAAANIFYNVAGAWEKTNYSGSVMIRPVVGPNFSYTNKSVEKPKTAVLIYPNPNTGSFSLMLDAATENYSDFRLKIYNEVGQLVEDLPYLVSYQLNKLEKGIYFLEFANPQTNVTYRGKMINFK